jgi:hypothetical protein
MRRHSHKLSPRLLTRLVRVMGLVLVVLGLVAGAELLR